MKKIDMGIHHLLCIGVNEYKSNKIPNLNNAVRDVKTISGLLIEKYQFTEENSISLIDSKATRSAIASRLRDYQTILNEDDSLVILFAGHGVWHKSTDEGFWVLNDAEFGDLESYLSLEKIKKIVGKIRAKHIFFLIDSCFSGNIFRDIAPNVEKQFNIPSRICFTSGRDEIVLDGLPGVHSPFASTVVDTLKNNKNDPFWTIDLCMDVIKKFPEEKKQTPRLGQLKELGDKGGQYVFFSGLTDYKPLGTTESLYKSKELGENQDEIKSKNHTEIYNASGNSQVVIKGGTINN